MEHLPLIVSGIVGIFFAFFFARFMCGKAEPPTKLIVAIVIIGIFFYGIIMYGGLTQKNAALFENSLLGLFSGALIGAFLYILFEQRKKRIRHK